MESIFTMSLWFTPVFFGVDHLFSFLCCVVLLFVFVFVLYAQWMLTVSLDCQFFIAPLVYLLYLLRKAWTEMWLKYCSKPWHLSLTSASVVDKNRIKCIVMACVNVLYGFEWCTLLLVRHYLFVFFKRRHPGEPNNMNRTYSM